MFSANSALSSRFSLLYDIEGEHIKRGMIGMLRRSVQEDQEGLSDDASLFDRYGSVIFAYILKHVHSREDAEDLTVEVFTVALEKNMGYRLPPEAQLAWLKKVTHNKLIDIYRKKQHRQHVDIDLFAEILYDNDEPEQVVLRREVDRQLHEHIKQLSPFQQQLLYLRYSHNLTSAEIGVLLNKTEDAIRQQLSRTRALLRACYQRQQQKGDD
jgi:RNA polymerase sigma-70 factor, ECF subfamily